MHILGITRWRGVTAAVSRMARSEGLRIQPFAEGSVQWVRAMREPATFVPRDFYGGERITSLTLGARLGLGAGHHP